MITVRYREILTTLAELDPWLDKLGIQPKRDRIHQALEIVQRAEEGYRKFRATREPTKIGNVGDFYFGLTEALEFHDIFQAFQHERPERVRPKLERALSGPLRPEEETTKNADARNVMFELALAAQLRLRGADVTVGEPDLTLRLNGLLFFVECKRPFREESIRPNVRDAAGQLRAKLDANEGAAALGIIAISVSRIFNPGTKIFQAATESSKERLGDQLQKMMFANERHWARLDLHPRVVAVLFHVSTPGVVEDKDIITMMTYSTVTPVGKEGPAFSVLKEKLPPLFDR